MKEFLIASFVVLFVIAILFVWFYFCAGVGDLKHAKKEFEIFGLKEGFVPQGLAFATKENKFLISGHMSKKNEPSRIYIVDEKTYQLEKFVTLFFGGKFFTGKASGISVFADSVFVSSEGRVFRVLLSDLIDAKNGESVRVLDSFETGNNADFCTVDGRFLWVGEHYKLGKTKTDTTHHITLESGEQSHAVAFAFPLSICSTCGVESKIPQKAIAIPDMVQGMCFADGKIYLSTSGSGFKSNVCVYDNVLVQKPHKKMVLDDKTVDLWEMCGKDLKKNYVLPEMSREIVWGQGKLFVLFNSASKKHKRFARVSLNHVFSIK